MNLDFYYLAEIQRKLENKKALFVYNEISKLMEIISDLQRQEKINEEKIKIIDENGSYGHDFCPKCNSDLNCSFCDDE